MNTVVPSVVELNVPTEQDDLPINIVLMKKIERCGRIAYRSEDKITETSYIQFIKGIVSRKHWSVLEHARICLNIKRSNISTEERQVLIDCLDQQPFLSHNGLDSEELCFTITGNLRAFLEWLSDSSSHLFILRSIKHYLAKQFPPVFGELVENDTTFTLKEVMFGLTEASDYHTFHVVTDRGVMAEWTRHRYNMSFTVESTRYCNYNKRGVTFCLPIPFVFSPTEKDSEDKWIYDWLKRAGCICDESIHDDGTRTFKVCSNGITYDGHVSMCASFTQMYIWRKHMETCECAYNELIERGCQPQAARSVLPNSLKSEFCVTGTDSAWKHFLELRCANDAHPQIRYLANQVSKLLFPNKEIVVG